MYEVHTPIGITFIQGLYTVHYTKVCPGTNAWPSYLLTGAGAGVKENLPQKKKKKNSATFLCVTRFLETIVLILPL